MYPNGELTGLIIEAAIEVHRHLGPGLIESVYETCFSYELHERNLNHERQKEIALIYKGISLDSTCRLDLVVEGKVIVELKSVEQLHPLHEAQILTYLKLTGIKTGLLINFNSRLLKDGIRRFVL
ncbi:MAG TPA: GxxExxY protein [Desulfuromonadales bacterium]|nr:GxxExxY protein [Desulfuromonadales bacterium]